MVRFCRRQLRRRGAAPVSVRASAGEVRRWRRPSRASAPAGTRGSARLRVARRALSDLARPEIRDAEIDVNRGSRRQQRNRALQACPCPREVTGVPQGGSEKRLAGPGGGIETDALPQFRQRTILRAAVPLRDTKVVVGLGGLRLERDRALEMDEGSRRDLPAGRE